MDYFHEKMEMVDKINDKLSKFLDKQSDMSLQESRNELDKCHQFVEETDKNLNTTNMRKGSVGEGTDYAAFFMCRCQLALYKHAVLLAHAFNLQGELDKQQKSKKKRHVNKFAKSH